MHIPQLHRRDFQEVKAWKRVSIVLWRGGQFKSIIPGIMVITFTWSLVVVLDYLWYSCSDVKQRRDVPQNFCTYLLWQMSWCRPFRLPNTEVPCHKPCKSSCQAGSKYNQHIYHHYSCRGLPNKWRWRASTSRIRWACTPPPREQWLSWIGVWMMW